VKRARSSSKARAAQMGWRQWIAAFAMLAFALQAQITQSHIHFAPVSETGINALVHALTTGPEKASKKNSSTDDPANCPICQAMAHSGQFVTPSAAAPVLSMEAVVVVPLFLSIAAANESVSHGWQSRAPPRH
jgi:Protein of unknown function (DUF2946)